MKYEIDDIEESRLHELEKQAALYGPQTDPAILIEIQELKNKRRTTSGSSRRQYVSGLDYEFLMNVVSAALVRLGNVEQAQKDSVKAREIRQLVHDVWMAIISVIMLLILYLQIAYR